MNISDKTDDQIVRILTPMIDHVARASNENDWANCSQYQTEEEASNPPRIEKTSKTNGMVPSFWRH